MDIQDKTREELLIELQELKQAYHSLKVSIGKDHLERKMAEEKLIALEQRSSAWLENSPVCTKIVDLDFNLQYMSTAGIKGLKIDDITPYYGKSYPFHFYPESFKAKMTGNMRKATETCEIIIQEAPVVDINSNEIWFHSTIVPVKDENDRIEYLLIVSLDITERKQAEEALRKSHDLLDTTFASLNDAIFILDDQAVIVKCNHAASQIFGYRQDEIQGQTTAFLHIDESALAEFRQHLYSAIEAKGRMDHFEFRMKRKDGTIFATDHSIIPHVNVQGRRLGWVSIVSDITERKKSEKVLEDIISKNPMSIQIVDKNGYTLSVNSSHTKLFGSVPPPDFTIFNDTQLEKQGFKELFERVKKGEIVHFPDTYFNVHDFNPEFPDVPVWVRGVIFPLLDSNGNPERFVLMQDDITERRKAEEEFKKAKAKAEESEERFRNAIENSPIPTAIAKNDGELILLNRQFVNAFGYTLQDIPSIEKWFELAYPNIEYRSYAVNDWGKEVENSIKNNVPTVYKEYQITCINGEIKTVAVSAYFEKDLSIGLFQDITERKKAEQARMETETLYRKMIENSPLGMHFYQLSSNNQLIFVGANPAADQLLGVDHIQFIGKTIEKAFPSLIQTEVPESYRNAAKNGILWATEQIVYDDKKISGAFEVRAFQTTPGNMVAVFANITERKQSEQIIQQKTEKIEVQNEELNQTNQELRKAKEKAEESELTFRKLFEDSVDAILLIDKTGVFVECNQAALNLLQMSREQFLFMPPVAISPEYQPNGRKSNEAAIEMIELAYKNGLNRFDWTCINAKNEVFIVEVSLMPIVVKGQTMLHTTWRDITKRKQDEIDLHKAKEHAEESELQFRQLFENAADAIFIADEENGIIIDVNQAAERLMLMPKNKIIGLHQSKLHPPVDETISKDTFLRQIQDITESKSAYLIENKVVRFDGTEVPVEILASKTKYKGKDCLVGTFRDVTERKKAELELLLANEATLASEDRFKTLSSNATEGLMIHESGIIVDANHAFAKLIGYASPDELIGKNALEITPLTPESKQLVFEHLIRNSHETFDVTLIEKNGSFIQAETRAADIVYKGRMSKLVYMINISDRKKIELELIEAKEHAEESDRLKSAFLANMSHEIRTPMNGILGFADLLSEPGLDKEEQQEYIKIIQKGGARMLNIINDIVDISKIEAGLMKVDYKDTNINEKIEFIYTFFKPQVEEKGMQLRFKNTLTEKEATIKTDSEKVNSIFINLVKNAIKYSEKGTIEFGYNRVETLHATSLLEFYVKDTGIGIPKDRQSAIFERFIQADIADKMARQGAGLGLSISKAYVEMLGGKIWVESEEGIGSTFYFTLPYTTEPVKKVFTENIAPADVSVETLHATSLLKILIAEDDETSEKLISITVKKLSKQVLETKTGYETVEICRTHPDIDLILMDIQMPEMNGYEATRQIRQFNKDVVIIAQTAYGLSGDREKAIEAGCNDYIAKPIIKDELLALIHKYFKK